MAPGEGLLKHELIKDLKYSIKISVIILEYCQWLQQKRFSVFVPDDKVVEEERVGGRNDQDGEAAEAGVKRKKIKITFFEESAIIDDVFDKNVTTKKKGRTKKVRESDVSDNERSLQQQQVHPQQQQPQQQQPQQQQPQQHQVQPQQQQRPVHRKRKHLQHQQQLDPKQSPEQNHQQVEPQQDEQLSHRQQQQEEEDLQQVDQQQPEESEPVVIVAGKSKSIDICPRCNSGLNALSGGYTLNLVTFDINGKNHFLIDLQR